MSKRDMIKTAKLEIDAWNLPNGLALAILFSFIHRLTEGETVEEMMDRFGEPTTDYQI